jgi:CRISPR-associated endonuclease/helicase Cas3
VEASLGTNGAGDAFDGQFAALTGFKPFCWRQRLFRRFAAVDVPAAFDLPTDLGKTSVMAIWLIARAHRTKLPRPLVYVVDRRAVVDQATDALRKNSGAHGYDGGDLKKRATRRQREDYWNG